MEPEAPGSLTRFPRVLIVAAVRFVSFRSFIQLPSCHQAGAWFRDICKLPRVKRLVSTNLEAESCPDPDIYMEIGHPHMLRSMKPISANCINITIKMASTAPVALILGSGPNVGLHVAKSLSAKGYKIATVSRTAKTHDGEPDQAKFEADLSQPGSIADVFAKVRATVGIPSVVIYNGELEFPQPGLIEHALMNI